jgi:hypothetical protein
MRPLALAVLLLSTRTIQHPEEQLVLSPAEPHKAAFDQRPSDTYQGWSSWSLQAYRGEVSRDCFFCPYYLLLT